MNPERWAQLKPLFQGALQQPPGRRGEWLREACSGDEALRADAQALIDAHETSGDFLENPAVLEPELDPYGETEGATLEPGTQIGPYIVRGELGRGGMGVVYLAEDIRLGRTVALKALPAAVAGDVTRRERLRREARAAAALTHPGIAVVYALEEVEGQLFIAAEYVRGRTLKAELADGPLPAARALDTAIEIARALCAAHEAGIVHRDLKPENILRTEDGRVKVLDFGIAQFTDRTLTQLTVAGAVVGTPAYMAPEQFLAADVDFRVDLYALGILIVEMTTGVHPFASGSIRAASDAERRAPMPPELKAISDRCLARDPRDRPSSTRQLVAELEAVRSGLTSGEGRTIARAGESTVAPALSPRWWWEFHQAVAALVYWLMAIPAWSARTLIGGRTGFLVFIVILAAVIVAANLRLHLWFTSRFYPRELGWVRGRTAIWITAADCVFTASLIAAGLLVRDERSALSILLLSFGIGAAVVFLFVEPVTARAAFRDPS